MRLSVSARFVLMAAFVIAVLGVAPAFAQGAPSQQSGVQVAPATTPVVSGCELRLAPKPQMSPLKADAALPAIPLTTVVHYKGFCPCGCSYVRDCNTSADCFGGAQCMSAPSCC